MYIYSGLPNNIVHFDFVRRIKSPNIDNTHKHRKVITHKN